jgi:PadR family transcriptional regulator, regulatory protein PadR
MMKRRDPADEAPLGTFEEQVMVAVIRVGREAYAMNLRREIEELTGRSVAIGSVYVTLDRLEAKGFIASSRTRREETVPRRHFTVTPAGALALSETKAMRDRLWAGVELRHVLKNA